MQAIARILQILPCFLILLTIACNLASCKPTTTEPSSHSTTSVLGTSSPQVYLEGPVLSGKRSLQGESMETSQTLIYGSSGTPYFCLPANPPAIGFGRRSGGAYKKKPRRGYSKYPWNYQ